MAVKSCPGHRGHGLDRHLVDAGEAGRPQEVGDPDMIGSLLACERSGNVVYCHLGIVEVEVVLEAVQLCEPGERYLQLPMTIPQAIWRRSGPLGMLYDSLLIIVSKSRTILVSLRVCRP
jgi:hypothetical protein